MKLVTFTQKDEVPSIGVLDNSDQTIVILQNGAKTMNGEPSPFFIDMLAFLRGGSAARDQAQAIVAYVSSQHPPDAVVSLDRVRLLAPVPRPESIRDAMVFEQHVINSTRVVGLRRFAFLDEWIERAFGRKRSLAYRFNKAWYERPIYYKSNRFSVVGPDSGVRLPAYTRKFDFELEWGVFIGKPGVDIAKAQARDHIGGYTITLHPGEFIGSGTCSGAQGRGCGLEMGKVLKAGDLVELEVERLGILRNNIVQSGE